MSVQKIETVISALSPPEQAKLSRWLLGRQSDAAPSEAKLPDAYRAMAQDTEREADALAWAELGTADVGHSL